VASIRPTVSVDLLLPLQQRSGFQQCPTGRDFGRNPV
jgi:hypothetical protein